MVPQRVEVAGAELQLLVLAADRAGCIGVDLASGALVRASHPEGGSRLRPYDVASGRLAEPDDPDWSRPELVTLAAPPFYADKSDLLALNASLEGTKAGEAGRGFALVAAEMRRLAESVMAAAREIKQLASDIRTAAADTVCAGEDGEPADQLSLSGQQCNRFDDSAASAPAARRSGDAGIEVRNAREDLWTVLCCPSGPADHPRRRYLPWTPKPVPCARIARDDLTYRGSRL